MPDPGSAPSPTAEILGSLPTVAPIGKEYLFIPEVKNLSGTLTFSVANKPGWVTFDESTGRFLGTPAPEHEGDYADIVISVSNGEATLSLAAVTIKVRFATEIVVSATRLNIHASEKTTLQWRTSYATKVTVAPEIGEVDVSGSREVSPTESTTYTFTATGEAGEVSREVAVVVSPALVADLNANVTSGPAPLKVLFTPLLQTQSAANRYYWDFEGDGGTVAVPDGPPAGPQGFDPVRDTILGGSAQYDVLGRGYTYTFIKPGTYNTRLLVIDANNVRRETSIAINVVNQPPAVTVAADKNNGEIPLTVSFRAAANDNEGIATLDWDFDGDGSYDYSSSTLTASYTYNKVGTYQSALRVRDTLGAETIVTPPHIEILARPEGAPAVIMTATPATGNAPLNVAFRASASVPGGSTVTSWQWDFDGDGVVDDSSGSDVSHTYTDGGSYYPKLAIKTTDGDSAETVAEVIIRANHSLSIVDSTIDPQEGGQAKIATKMGGRGPATLVIQDRGGKDVRSLVPWSDRDSGDYVDVWDGRDDSNVILPPGDYYALLKYRVAGSEQVLDYRASTGGLVFFPTNRSCVGDIRSDCGTLTVPTTPLAPLAQQPWIFTFTTPRVADVTSFMSVYTTNNIVSSFVQGRPMGVGSYEIMWNGEGTDGRLLPTVSTAYLITVMGRTLADNAIVLNHFTRLSNLAVSPSILYPNATADSGATASTLKFDLSHRAAITFVVQDVETGGEVFRREYPDVDPGAGLTISWDGKNVNGVPLAPGSYLLSLAAQRADGDRSLPVKMMQRIAY